jgi:uncharacterized 2Fe-2S/4Fe-4S cluster protein (DUF4445 family)
MPTITVLPDQRSIRVVAGESVLDACRRAGVLLQASCGGEGTCGKCVVRVLSGDVPADPVNVRGLTDSEVRDGYRLACRLVPESDLTLEVPASSRAGDEQILTATVSRAQRNGRRPNVRAVRVELAPPSMGDQASDLARLAGGLGADGNTLRAGLPQLRELAAALRSGQFSVTATLCGQHLLRAEAVAQSPVYGMAYDIGTTTVVGYLIDLATGRDLALGSRSNPQRVFGDDVLSRSDYAAKGESQLNELQRLIIGCLQEIAGECAERAGISLDRCYEVTLAGNTIMLHLALGVDPRNIARVPFTPVWTGAREFAAAELGFHLHPAARTYLLPCVAGYVGADITAGIIAADMEQREKPTLFVDIGTNGEMVLGDRTRRISCASPAGPAFEGARISCGSRAVGGAIDRVRFDPACGDLAIHTLGDKPAAGICGTGLIDAVAVLLQQGLLEPNGLLLDPDDAVAKGPLALAARVREGEKGSEFLLVPREQTQDGRRDLVLTQRDLRELQLAKGAIRAGVEMALRFWGIHGGQLDKVLIAGGFGNYICPESALAVGLFPEDVRLDQLEFVGNTAAAGAKLCLSDVAERDRVERLAAQTEYIELSGRSDFQEVFMEAMLFPGE